MPQPPQRGMRRGSLPAAMLAVAAIATALTGCTEGPGLDADPAATPTSTATSDRASDSASDSAASATPPPTGRRTSPARDPGSDPPRGSVSEPADLGGPGVRPDAMLGTVRLLAGRIGPREATSAAYTRAAAVVQRWFERYGYQVSRQRFQVPAGVSWGVPVDAGRSFNVLAAPPGFDATRPHRVVGAHLDTVPQAPGAEDNASGVAVLLELARLAARPAGPGGALPTLFVAYGAEEPRGEGDALHHFGSTAHVRRLGAAERDALTAMVSLDRVGVGAVVPVCTGGRSALRVRDELLRLAARADIPATGCTDNTASDHWSYEKAGVTAARIGGTSYAEYHSAADRPGVPRRSQLRRVAELTWSWLRG